MKQAEDKLIKKQVSRERELGQLKREEIRERLYRSEVAFNTWKHLKDAEYETERELLRRQQRFITTPMKRGIYNAYGRGAIRCMLLFLRAHAIVARVLQCLVM